MNKQLQVVSRNTETQEEYAHRIALNIANKILDSGDESSVVLNVRRRYYDYSLSPCGDINATEISNFVFQILCVCTDTSIESYDYILRVEHSTGSESLLCGFSAKDLSDVDAFKARLLALFPAMLFLGDQSQLEKILLDQLGNVVSI